MLSSNFSYSCCVVEVFKHCFVHLHWMICAVVHGDHKIEEVALSHVFRWLLLELSRYELMVRTVSVKEVKYITSRGGVVRSRRAI